MPSFKRLSSMSGRHSYSLFDIRLEQDFIVFRGNDNESAGQLLKGVVVLCLSTPLRIEDVHLRLTGTLRQNWADYRASTTGISAPRIDKTVVLLEHRWEPFVSIHGKSMTLEAGNYEYPFEFALPGDTAESVEGIPEASITYRLKATVSRGKLAYDLHAYKPFRIIRTPNPASLDHLHTMHVASKWPNKIDYWIGIPHKAVIFGAAIQLKMRFTPMLKGLALGGITARFVESRDLWVQSPTGLGVREYHTEREVSVWRFHVNDEDHWHDMIEGTGQEGWALTKTLALPRRLRQCVQDVNHHSIKVRHRIKMAVHIQNPEGHMSELRATLPISIFISPDLPFDDEGTLVVPAQGSVMASGPDASVRAPPGYGQHVLDQLYESVDCFGIPSPAVLSGVSSPITGASRTGSADNLAALAQGAPVTPAALLSRLADVSIDSTRRSHSFASLPSIFGRTTPPSAAAHGPSQRSETQSDNTAPTHGHDGNGNDNNNHNSRRVSVESFSEPEEPTVAELSRVPSYATAVRTPTWPRLQTDNAPLPDYQTAVSEGHAPSHTHHEFTPAGCQTCVLQTPTDGRTQTSAPLHSAHGARAPEGTSHQLSVIAEQTSRESPAAGHLRHE